MKNPINIVNKDQEQTQHERSWSLFVFRRNLLATYIS